MSGSEYVLATTGLDCAAKVRISYRLPGPIHRSWVERLASGGGGRLVIDDFSSIVPGSFDHATVTRDHEWMAKAVLGHSEVVVTFYRSRARDTREDVAQFETVAFEGIGKVVHRAGRGELPSVSSLGSA